MPELDLDVACAGVELNDLESAVAYTRTRPDELRNSITTPLQRTRKKEPRTNENAGLFKRKRCRFYGIIVTCEAVAAGRLVNTNEPLVTVTMIL